MSGPQMTPDELLELLKRREAFDRIWAAAVSYLAWWDLAMGPTAVMEPAAQQQLRKALGFPDWNPTP